MNIIGNLAFISTNFDLRLKIKMTIWKFGIHYHIIMEYHQMNNR